MNSSNMRSLQRDLFNLIDGEVLDAGDVGYRETIGIDNGRVNHEPKLVVVPDHTEDVAAIVKFCRKNDLRLTTKSGGHSANGYCLNSDGVVLDLRRLNSVEFLKGGTGLSIGAGTRWIEAYDFLRVRRSDHIIVGGGCPGVGVGGFLLGGGFSFVSRSYGLGSDSVCRMKFVDADGEIHELKRTTKKKNEAELFWALQGAGGGNMGIVTEFDVKTHKTLTPRMMVGQISFPFYRIREVLGFYNTWASTLPNEIALYGMMRYFPDPRRDGERILSLRFTPIFNGPIDKGLKIVEPLLALLPNSLEFNVMTIPEWENYIGNATLISGRSAYIRSVVLKAKTLTDDVAEICMRYMGRAPSRESYVVWTHTGGKVGEIDPETSSYPHRDAEFVFEVKSIWESSSPERARENVKWALDFFDEIGAHGKGAYINYIDPLLKDWKTQYYGDSMARLDAVRNHWDPSGFFMFQQGIGSAFQPDLSEPIDLSPLERTF